MLDRTDRALSVLVRLNEARRIGQLDAAAELDAELEAIDAEGGYSRGMRANDQHVYQHGEKCLSGTGALSKSALARVAARRQEGRP